MKVESRKNVVYMVIVVILLAISIGILSVYLGRDSKKIGIEGLDIDFSRPAYEEYNQQTLQEGIGQMTLDSLKPFHPTVLSIAETRETKGYEQMYLEIFNALSKSEDERELVDIETVFLSSRVRNPSIIFEEFENANSSSWTEQESIAASFLVAHAYLDGDFTGAILSENEQQEYGDQTNPARQQEIQEKINAIYGQLAEEGMNRLRTLFESYPDSRLGVLARFSYAGQLAKENQDRVDFSEETLRLVQEFYPNTLLETIAITQLAAAYRSLGNYQKALDLYRTALQKPDVQATINETVHQLISEDIAELEKKLEL